MICILLLCFIPFTGAWTLDLSQCSGLAPITETELGVDQFVPQQGMNCIPGEGIQFQECLNHTQFGGSFILDPRNPNLSIQVDFSVPHPLPESLTLFSIHGQGGRQDLYLVMNYYPDMNLTGEAAEFVSPHFFTLNVPALLTSTGYCDRIQGVMNILFFTYMDYVPIMESMRNNNSIGRTYSLRFMFIKMPSDPTPFALVRLQDGEGREGWMYSPTSLGFNEQVDIHEYHLLGTHQEYEIGCSSVQSSYPGLLVRGLSISQHVFTP